MVVIRNNAEKAKEKAKKLEQKMQRKQKQLADKEKKRAQKQKQKEERLKEKAKRKDPKWQAEQKQKKIKEKALAQQKKLQQKEKSRLQKQKDKVKRQKDKQKALEKKTAEKLQRKDPQWQAEQKQKKMDLKLKNAQNRAKAKIAKEQANAKKKLQKQEEKAKRKDPRWRAEEKIRRQEAKKAAKQKKLLQKQKAAQKKIKDKEKKAAQKAIKAQQHPPMDPKKKFLLLFVVLWLVGSAGGAGVYFYQHPKPEVAVERYLQAFVADNTAKMATYGEVDIDFVSENIANDPFYQSLAPTMQSKVHDIEFTVGEPVISGEKATISTDFVVYDLGKALRDALVEFRKENLVQVVAGHYEQSELDAAMITSLQESLDAAEKNGKFRVEIVLDHSSGKWRVEALRETNQQLAYVLTACIYGEKPPKTPRSK